ncbi:putative membrane protein [Rhizobium leucaenae]|nr:hypothetical protein [Rhizobium leucaenae]MBB6303924.1 putative membrane protein [Rhizobium leucaenae]
MSWPAALLGLIVAALLVVGTIPIFASLVVMPTLGHPTWHLYRKSVASAYPHRTL